MGVGRGYAWKQKPEDYIFLYERPAAVRMRIKDQSQITISSSFSQACTTINTASKYLVVMSVCVYHYLCSVEKKVQNALLGGSMAQNGPFWAFSVQKAGMYTIQTLAKAFDVKICFKVCSSALLNTFCIFSSQKAYIIFFFISGET